MRVGAALLLFCLSSRSVNLRDRCASTKRAPTVLSRETNCALVGLCLQQQQAGYGVAGGTLIMLSRVLVEEVSGSIYQYVNNGSIITSI